jgi:hypothetical protein
MPKDKQDESSEPNRDSILSKKLMDETPIAKLRR